MGDNVEHYYPWYDEIINTTIENNYDLVDFMLRYHIPLDILSTLDNYEEIKTEYINQLIIKHGITES